MISKLLTLAVLAVMAFQFTGCKSRSQRLSERYNHQERAVCKDRATGQYVPCDEDADIATDYGDQGGAYPIIIPAGATMRNGVMYDRYHHVIPARMYRRARVYHRPAYRVFRTYTVRRPASTRVYRTSSIKASRPSFRSHSFHSSHH